MELEKEPMELEQGPMELVEKRGNAHDVKNSSEEGKHFES